MKREENGRDVVLNDIKHRSHLGINEDAMRVTMQATQQHIKQAHFATLPEREMRTMRKREWREGKRREGEGREKGGGREEKGKLLTILSLRSWVCE